jgi:prepilin-type N-terminal cleavage/methylation domain-containing protein
LTVQKLKNNLGFTLVELLIVIALLGAIALIVIAAINPIEQANRAKDTRFKADGAQMISAVDRYFASFSEFPWVTADIPAGVENDDAYGFVSASTIGVGLCATANCDPRTLADRGELISSDELKSEFMNRDFAQYTGIDASKKLFIGKPAGTSESVYACFIPASKSVRGKALSDGNVYHLTNVGGRNDGSDCTTDAWDTTELTGCYVCIPE